MTGNILKVIELGLQERVGRYDCVRMSVEEMTRKFNKEGIKITAQSIRKYLRKQDEGLKYGEDQFSESNKPIKNDIEEEFVKELEKQNIKGDVLALVGPNLEKHYKRYMRIMHLTSKLFIAENEKGVYNLLINKKHKYGMTNVTIQNKDFLKVFNGADAKFGTLDLDTCITPDGLLKDGFLNKLNSIFSSGKLKSKIGVITTFTQRKALLKGRHFYNALEDIAEKNYYRVLKTIKVRYKDKLGTPMETCLFIFKKIYGVVPRETPNQRLLHRKPA